MATEKSLANLTNINDYQNEIANQAGVAPALMPQKHEGHERLTGKFAKGNQIARKNKGLRHKINREIQEALAGGLKNGKGIGEALTDFLSRDDLPGEQFLKALDMAYKAQLNPNLYIDLEGDELAVTATDIQDSILALIGRKREETAAEKEKDDE